MNVVTFKAEVLQLFSNIHDEIDVIWCGQVGVIDRVDQIYRATTWSSDYKGFGFEIKEVRSYNRWNF